MQSGKFLQSKEWEEFQKSLGRKVWRINDELIIKMPPHFGISFLFSPKGPREITDTFLNEIKKIAKRERVIFYRCEPQEDPPKKFIKTKSKNKNPKCTQILNLDKSEDNLLAGMKQKTRYNIKLAQKKEAIIKQQTINNRQQLFEEFYDLLKNTAERQGIRLHPKKYYEELAEFNKIFIAYYKNKPIAGAMVNFYEKTATYLHGGSSQEHKEVMAPYLLHWEIIKEAKSRGFKFYDWWGISEKWPGITRFKQGFGGEAVCAPGTYDLPINKLLYKIYTLKKIGK